MHAKGIGTGRAPDTIETLRVELARARDRIEALEADLARKQKSISRLLADDIQTCEELAELQRIIWGYHRGLSGGCECAICTEVERSRREMGDLC